MSLDVQGSISVSGNTTACQQWRDTLYSRHRLLAKTWQYKHHLITKKSGYVEANRWLVDQEKQLKLARTGLYCNADDCQIVDYCEAKAKKVEKQIIEAAHLKGSLLTLECLTELLEVVCEKAGVAFPVKDSSNKNSVKAAIRRLVDPVWWRRQLRKTAGRQFEGYMRRLGRVSVSKQIYCSDFTLRRRTEQRSRNRLLLESLEAENSSGQVFTLAELSDKSVSNPINRRNELMARIKGFEEYTKSPASPAKYDGLFLTLTTPSKFHPQLSRKTKSGKRYAIENTKFNGTSPLEANDYLCKVWANIRAEWRRNGIQAFGFRMAEPHHDGTPHWHLILFIPDNLSKLAVEIFKDYALREDGDEPGAKEYRVDVVRIDPTKGSAAGYCAKYVAKNIDGFSIDKDSYGKNAVISAMRIEAWASTWGIRQFQQIGGPSVTVWREARRIKECDTIDLTEQAKTILTAADLGDWQTYTELMGGAICPLKDRPIRPQILTKIDLSQYGEAVDFVYGILVFGESVPTRTENWVIRRVSNTGLNQAAPAAANAPPRACA